MEWDAIVKSFENHDIYLLSGYVKASEVSTGDEGILIYYENEEKRALNVVMKRVVDETSFDFITPYGYGGPLLDAMTQDEFRMLYNEFCLKNNIISEYIRFNPILQNFMKDSIEQGKTIYIDTESEEIVWNNIISKNKNVIRKAIKNDVKVYSSDDFKLIDKFMEIYKETMDRDGASEQYYFAKEYYRVLMKELKGNILIYYAEKNNEIIAMSMFFHCNKKADYHLSCSKKEYMTYAPSNLIIYTAASDFSKKGITKLHLGGGLAGKEDSLFKFKKSFNKNGELTYYIGKNIYNKEEYMRLCKEKENIKEDFFPAYRG